MSTYAIHLTNLALILAAQMLIAVGLGGFGIIARLQEEKAFPGGGGKWKRIPRLMHRNRLHIMQIMVMLEIVLIAVITRYSPRALEELFRTSGDYISIPVFLPVTVYILLLTVAAVSGIGLASKRPGAAALIVSYPFFPVYLLLRPLSSLVFRTISLVFPDLAREISSPLFLLPQQEERKEGFIEENGSMLMQSIVEFGEKKVREVMVPRIDVFALNVRMPVDEIRDRVSEAGHSRVPIYEDNIDRIIGILCVKDLVRTSGESNGGISRLLRDVYFVPEGKKIEELLREFQVKKMHMAVVVDEYGGTSGIVTLEDILEEIVGEIRDEHDQEGPLFREAGDGMYIVEGRIDLDELSDELRISILSEEVDTLGGFLYELIGRIPEEGEEIEYNGIRFRIERLDGQRIAEVLMALPPEDSGGQRP